MIANVLAIACVLAGWSLIGCLAWREWKRLPRDRWLP